MIKAKGIISGAGAIAFIIGMGGMAGAAEGEGSFIISAIVFSIGFGLSLWSYRR